MTSSDVETLPNYFDREPSQALTIDDVRSTRFDRCAWTGKIHPEVAHALAEQILRSIRDEQPGANSVVKGLAAVYFEVTG